MRNNKKRVLLTICFLLLCCNPIFAATQTKSDGSLSIFDNGTVVDSKTDLMWAQSDNGEDTSWVDALLFAESFSLDSFNDWRLPTREELTTLLRAQPNTNGLRISAVFDLQSIFLYASETKRCKAAYADLSNGSFNWVTQSRNDFGRVLLVRNNK